MTLRDCGFLLVGLGTGLLMSFVAMLQTVSWIRHMFVVEVHWPAYAWMASPWVLLASGVTILYRQRRGI